MKVNAMVCDNCGEIRNWKERGWVKWRGMDICYGCMRRAFIEIEESPAMNVETDTIGFREEKDNERV